MTEVDRIIKEFESGRYREKYYFNPGTCIESLSVSGKEQKEEGKVEEKIEKEEEKEEGKGKEGNKEEEKEKEDKNK